MAAIARVLQSPELVRTTYQFSNHPEQFRLLRVSRSFFNAGAAVIWEKVEGVHILLSLLPGVHCTDHEGDPKAKTIVSAYLDAYLHLASSGYKTISAIPTDLTRFNTYAPFVKFLEIYGKDIEKYWIPNWRGFAASARNETLLPNLKTLTLATTSDCSTSQLMWIRAFLSPSLIRIQVKFFPTHAPLISYCAASAVLRYIAETCPDVRLLAIFPDSRPSEESSLESHDERAMIDFWDSSLAPHLKRLRSLSQLVGTTELLSPDNLIHLASMQNLSRLTLYPTTTPFEVVEPTSIGPTTGFTALKRFSLFTVTPTLIEKIWRLRIFNSLTSLELSSVTFPPNTEDGQLHASAITMLSHVAKSSPHLSKITIKFDPPKTGKPYYDLGTISVLDPLKALQLKEMYLQGASLGVLPLQRPPQTIEYYLRHLVKLELPKKLCSFVQLYEFARLPNLDHLIVNLRLRTPEAEAPSINNSNFRVLESSSGTSVLGDVHVIAS